MKRHTRLLLDAGIRHATMFENVSEATMCQFARRVADMEIARLNERVAGINETEALMRHLLLDP